MCKELPILFPSVAGEKKVYGFHLFRSNICSPVTVCKGACQQSNGPTGFLSPEPSLLPKGHVLLLIFMLHCFFKKKVSYLQNDKVPICQVLA